MLGHFIQYWLFMLPKDDPVEANVGSNFRLFVLVGHCCISNETCNFVVLSALLYSLLVTVPFHEEKCLKWQTKTCITAYSIPYHHDAYNYPSAHGVYMIFNLYTLALSFPLLAFWTVRYYKSWGGGCCLFFCMLASFQLLLESVSVGALIDEKQYLLNWSYMYCNITLCIIYALFRTLKCSRTRKAHPGSLQRDFSY